MSNIKPAFYAMSLDELSSWVAEHNDDYFDCIPTVEELDDDEMAEAREELESMADQIWHKGVI